MSIGQANMAQSWQLTVLSALAGLLTMKAHCESQVAARWPSALNFLQVLGCEGYQNLTNYLVTKDWLGIGRSIRICAGRTPL